MIEFNFELFFPIYFNANSKTKMECIRIRLLSVNQNEFSHTLLPLHRMEKLCSGGSERLRKVTRTQFCSHQHANNNNNRKKNRQCVCECTVFHANIKLEFAWSYVGTKLQIQQNTNRCKNNKNGTIYWIINAENIKLINTRNGVTGDVGESIDCLFILSRQTDVKVAYNERWMLPNNWLQKASRIVFSLSPQSI